MQIGYLFPKIRAYRRPLEEHDMYKARNFYLYSFHPARRFSGLCRSEKQYLPRMQARLDAAAVRAILLFSNITTNPPVLVNIPLKYIANICRDGYITHTHRERERGKRRKSQLKPKIRAQSAAAFSRATRTRDANMHRAVQCPAFSTLS